LALTAGSGAGALGVGVVVARRLATTPWPFSAVEPGVLLVIAQA
jgi:hypothetical protein